MTASQPQLDSSWWDQAELRPVLASRDVAGIFRWLQRHGWSQTQIGARTYQSQGEVSEILNGRQVKAYDVLERVADAFEIPRGRMGLAYSSSAEGESDKSSELTCEDRRDFAGAVASVAFGSVSDQARKWLPEVPNSLAAVPPVITDSDVEQVGSMTLEFRKLDQRYGGGAAVDAARGFYGYARRMIHSTADQRTHRDLKVSLADFSSMLGWSFHDIGDQAAARRFLMNALVLAKDADEPSLAASILYRFGRVSMQEAQPVEALKMLQLGQLAAQDAGDPAEVARLHANEALAYAMLGKHDHVLDAFARAEHEMGRADRAGCHRGRRCISRQATTPAIRRWSTTRCLVTQRTRHKPASTPYALSNSRNRPSPSPARTDRAEAAPSTESSCRRTCCVRTNWTPAST
ncbi:helix-turn-helix transcriptional regulator [Kribbella sp. NPDC051137]|uniref:helix-turn-helix domain-containing protein n=1 Tax=Kribbella sp. NPDC051137 TaxID=3155045 RepID=UPI00343D1CAC